MIPTAEALSHEEQPSLTCEHLLALGRELAASLKGKRPVVYWWRWGAIPGLRPICWPPP